MDNLEKTGFFIDGWRVSPDEGVLVRADEVVHLEPKVMEVLVYFASRPGEVITREELERDVWRGALIGYDAVTATVIKLRKALLDNARQPRIIATIPKKGYQLIVPVNPSEDNDIEVSIPVSTTTQTTKIFRKPALYKLAVVGAILVVVLVFTWQELLQQSDTPLPSIVVLPIENLDTTDNHAVFVDGITEDIITDLSRMSNLMVFASNTTFKYRGRQMTPQALRDELNVDFILKGTARHEGNNIRINVQLINSRTGFNIWAQRYDREVKEVFAVQDDITTSLINALAIKLSSREKRQLARRATSNLEAYEHFLEGQRLSRAQTKQTNARAREEYKQAIKIDPAYGRAYGALAYTLAFDYRHGWTDTPVENLERALGLAEQGVALDNSIPQTYWSLGYVYLRRNEYENARRAAAESIRVAPNYADGYGLLALIHNGLGQPEVALKYANRGMQLNPYYTWDYLLNVGFSNYLLGNYTQAIEILEKAQERNENAIPIKLFLAASYVQANRLSDAEWTVDQIQILNPATTLSHTAEATILTKPKLKNQFLNDLRIAGLPE
ncbi:MAG: winged helix-turn-helix domain-containing protein [Proteobacteria bacterium]|nr:winged helix-turn-helix domain-containing protein [Pseudomonadota bacterium]